MAIVELEYLKDKNRVHFCYTDSKNQTIEGDVVPESSYWENWRLYETNSNNLLDIYTQRKWGILAATNDMIKRKLSKRKTFIPEIGYGDTLAAVIMPFQFIRKDGTNVKGKIRATNEHRIDDIDCNVKLTRIEKQILTEMAFDLVDLEL
jgi:hypothetical protein